MGAGGTAAAHPPSSQSIILGRAFVGGTVGWARPRGSSGALIPREGDTSEHVVLNCIQNLRNRMNALGSAQKIQGGIVTFHQSLAGDGGWLWIC